LEGEPSELHAKRLATASDVSAYFKKAPGLATRKRVTRETISRPDLIRTIERPQEKVELE
jgi:hypothetical protein